MRFIYWEIACCGFMWFLMSNLSFSVGIFNKYHLMNGRCVVNHSLWMCQWLPVNGLDIRKTELNWNIILVRFFFPWNKYLRNKLYNKKVLKPFYNLVISVSVCVYHKLVLHYKSYWIKWFRCKQKINCSYLIPVCCISYFCFWGYSVMTGGQTDDASLVAKVSSRLCSLFWKCLNICLIKHQPTKLFGVTAIFSHQRQRNDCKQSNSHYGNSLWVFFFLTQVERLVWTIFPSGANGLYRQRDFRNWNAFFMFLQWYIVR